MDKYRDEAPTKQEMTNFFPSTVPTRNMPWIHLVSFEFTWAQIYSGSMLLLSLVAEPSF
jgi:hypothetical protein